MRTRSPSTPGVKPIPPELQHLKFSRSVIVKLRPGDFEQVQAVVRTLGTSASAFGRQALLRAARRAQRQQAEGNA